ncbi:MAG TPA: ethanolamine utilization protein EutN [Anaerolineae bacterium]|nr:ethanolamine utilization protein EutN [Anaerolineae bacterium]
MASRASVAARITEHCSLITAFYHLMLIARVVGSVVSTVKHPSLRNYKLLIVQPLHAEGQEDPRDFVALDVAHAGVGDVVLVNQEGGGAREVLNDPDAPVISLIVGVIDSVELKSISHAKAPRAQRE